MESGKFFQSGAECRIEWGLIVDNGKWKMKRMENALNKLLNAYQEEPSTFNHQRY